MMGIYKITNKINGKVYIGQSKDIKKRFENHRCMNGSNPMYEDMRKYGLENFTFEVLEECEEDKLLERELYYMKKYKSVENGYNLTYESNPVYDERIKSKMIENMTERHRSAEYRERQSEITKELWRNEEYRQKILSAIRSEESIQKISETSKKLWQERREELVSKIKASLNAEEVRKERSIRQKERFKDEVYKQKINEVLKGAVQKYSQLMKEDKEFRNRYINKRIHSSRERAKPVIAIDKETGMEIMCFFSLGCAAKWIRENTKYKKADYATIRKAAQNENRTAYGYKWKLHKSQETIPLGE